MLEANKKFSLRLVGIAFFAALLGLLLEIYLISNHQNKKPADKQILSKGEKIEILNDLAKPDKRKVMTLEEKIDILNSLKIKK